MVRLVIYGVGSCVTVGVVIAAWVFFACTSPNPNLETCSVIIMKEVQWTDLIVALSSVLTFVLLLDTALKWREKMVRDGAYLLTQEYVSLLGDADETLMVSYCCYDNCVPQAGSFVLTKEGALPDIIKGAEACRELQLVAYRLRQKKLELRFWKVDFGEELETIHDEVIKELGNYFVIHGVVGRKLENYYIHNLLNTSSDLNSMATELGKLRERFHIVKEVLEARFEMKYEKCFRFRNY